MIRISQVSVRPEQEQAVVAVIRSGQLAMGERTRDLEEKFSRFFGGAECVAVSNGTVALTLALRAAGVHRGSEVITSAFSFFGTIEPVLQLGASPVFVDVDARTGNLDVSQVESAISQRTAAIVPVHLYGRPVPMATLREVSRKWAIPIVEDACQAIGARHLEGDRVGASGVAVFSFYGSKNITCGEGGMVTSTDPAIAEQVRLLRNHGSSTAYHHQSVGYNARWTDLQAALLETEVDRVDSVTSGRQKNAAFYEGAVRNPSIQKPLWTEGDGGCWHQYTVRTGSELERTSLQKWADHHGIESRVYYPTPLSALPIIRELGYAKKCPVADSLSRTVLSVPVRETLSLDEVEQVAAMLNTWRPGS